MIDRPAESRFIYLILSIAVLLFAGCELLSDQLEAIPADSLLEKRFVDQRADFEKVLAMSDEDPKVIRIAYDFTWVLGEKMSGEIEDRPIGFSEQRWQDYKAIFRKLGLESGISRGENDGSVWFLVYNYGIAPSGLSKGYVFTRESLPCTDDSLNDTKVLHEKRFACKKLDENWYLFISS